jgi:hypothetical protein
MILFYKWDILNDYYEYSFSEFEINNLREYEAKYLSVNITVD